VCIASGSYAIRNRYFILTKELLMNKFVTVTALAGVIALTSACTRIETGEVGVRVGFDKQVKEGELVPGSFNQTIVGEVLTFPVKDVQVDVKDMTPLASDNSTIADFDASVVYSVNPTSVAEIYTTKNRGFHAVTEDGDTLLMYNYIFQLTRNAAYKVARKYESLKMADNRADIENAIREEIVQNLNEEKLGASITISQVLVRQITPAKSIVDSANALVRAQNEQKQKEVEVKTAKLEAERIAALNANSGATKYMEATALVTLAEAVKDGKVNTIVVPYDFKGIVNVGK
jgi:regulator of protease activity HflC (stomatin/prohibitin superfamily)